MRITYVGHTRNHGWHTMASSPEPIRLNDGRVRRDSVLCETPDVGGVKLWFVGKANMNARSDHQIVLDMSDDELIEIFKARFGLESSPLTIAGDRAKAEMERRLRAGHTVRNRLRPNALIAQAADADE